MARKATSQLDAARDAAAAWVVRLSDPGCVEADRAAFARWRGQSLDHDLAYERERFTWERLDRLKALRPRGEDQQPDLLAPAKSAPPPRSEFAARSPVRWAAAACLVGAVAATIAAIGPWSSQAYATAIGERRVVILPDRTRVELNTDTKIVVSFRGGRRQVRLVRGEAVFDLARGAQPLTILADGAVVRTTSAEMDVRLDGETTALVVSRGSAALERRAAPPIQISTATELSYRRGRAVARPISSDDINRNLAWRQDGIDLTGRTLNEAAAEFNRYNTRQVLVTDPTISGLRLGGYFHSSDVDGFVKAVTITFPVAARSDEAGQVVLSRRGAVSPQAGTS